MILFVFFVLIFCLFKKPFIFYNPFILKRDMGHAQGLFSCDLSV